ncbi:SDR family NAD(P)-dependent oxidoreductase [Microbacterium excoecariae]|uniref:SDR family NAD(P)-dependent oxidoreductase n=1 Tax=Microbacterium excoecariae TaxID=2715210 RepID=UPI00197C8F78|nr:SDR family NAD(P)-dependent oxidoreductase [Microbacterium excoecariae]NHI15860.1 SDR family NAD(P)-dependent oxidoreductase [Microbacterium excoecariae]
MSDMAAQGPALQEWDEEVISGRFAGRTIIVTGAGSGIGRATASRIAREGGRVIAVDMSAEGLAAFAAEHGDADVVTVEANITDAAAIARIVEAAGERIDGLANVAGIMDRMQPVHEVEDALWEKVFAVNVTGSFLLMKAVIPGMLERGAGSIVNVASEAGLRGSAAGTAYTASKHAVVGMTKSSAYLYALSGLRINAVAPGAVATGIEAPFASEFAAPRIQRGMAAIPSIAQASQLAASISFLLSDDATNLNGVILPSDGGWSAA